MAWRFQTAQSNYTAADAELRSPASENRYRTGVPASTPACSCSNGSRRTDAATAEVTFYTSVVEYQKALTDLHFRKGTLLELNNVHLAEGMWTPEAYNDALRRAWARSYALDAPDVDPVHPEPENFERHGWIGGVDMIDAGQPTSGDPGDPAGVHSKSGALSFPAPAKQDGLPPEQPLPDETPTREGPA